MDNVIKIIVIFGKYHIHKAKCMLALPTGRLFSIDLNIFYESLTSIQNNRRAVKTSQLLKRILVLDTLYCQKFQNIVFYLSNIIFSKPV